MQHFGSLLEGDRRVTELYIITELLKSDEFDKLPSETRVYEFVGYDKISKENIEIIKTIYFEITGKDVDKIIESTNESLERRLAITDLTEEEFIELKSKGILLWMYGDKLIYALATFLESEKMTIDEIREFLLNNPETWT